MKIFWPEANLALAGKIKLMVFAGVIFCCLPFFVSAASLGEKINFSVDHLYDKYQREEVSAVLKSMGGGLYFYIDEEWLKSLSPAKNEGLNMFLYLLGSEFYNNACPKLISNYGAEWRPGIDKDERVTVLLHPLKAGAGGYFNSGDEYEKTQNPRSNQREMIYLNTDYIDSPWLKGLLAHEFVHLISFNQKENLRGVAEDIWLNEGRADYSSTLLGYDDVYGGSNLEKRVRVFSRNPSDSITEWTSQEEDYGALNLFIQYLVDQYGMKILSDSLRMKETGINSIDIALKNNGFKEDFSQVFTNWTIAMAVNDCSLGERYCYKNKNLTGLKIIPSVNFLPLNGASTLGVSNFVKNWSGSWIKFIGGKGTLKVKFVGNPENLFKVPYISIDSSGVRVLKFFQLNSYQIGEISVSDFGAGINSVIIIPSIQSKISGFVNPEPSFPFFWEVSLVPAEEKTQSSNPFEKPVSNMSKQEVLAKISEIEKLLGQLKERLAQIETPQKPETSKEPSSFSCKELGKNLSFGLNNDSDVKCLQEFLKAQGSEIYPEGVVSGNFFTLTKNAVGRFQEKYVAEILTPLGLKTATGFVGAGTRAKINKMMSGEQ
ncbi:MAG: hypothetical protein COX37_01165 [Candidatus Nealsonbacteria bacterium CG23_combo_of_CG06-09_8_20_14_all_39_17]|uniref:Peptidoglycan binding-like domain-containing protein n=1 Tax=Candidatus Nealsonbacteria bacterium CG23_combo_of_CG06-09_8_20_14_all_39_17 TaxID=1974722 RepID=A0A2G9YUR2_9BACT|nr:MAG: hypothetical protein COX37_01165 [Candidatus Nealsonbacteria bacterium CG23_combo_of_CG06-09_8_20_14_all_39_17]